MLSEVYGVQGRLPSEIKRHFVEGPVSAPEKIKTVYSAMTVMETVFWYFQ